MEEWEEYFRGLLGRVGNKVVRGAEIGNRERNGEKRVSKGEISGAVKKLTNGKAAEIDEIPREVWRYGGGELERWVEEWLGRIWEGEGWPESWREGVLCRL